MERRRSFVLLVLPNIGLCNKLRTIFQGHTKVILVDVAVEISGYRSKLCDISWDK